MEKSKSEAITEQKPIVLTIMYILMVFVSIYINYVNINRKEISSHLLLMIQEKSYSIMWQITPLLLFCTSLFTSCVGVLEEKETYKRNVLVFLCFLVGEVLLLVFWLMLIMLTGEFIYYILMFLEIFMGFLFFAQIVNEKKIYREYSNNVMACFVDEPVLLYSANSVLQELISMLEIEPEFNNRVITYKKINDLSVLTDDDAKSLING